MTGTFLLFDFSTFKMMTVLRALMKVTMTDWITCEGSIRRSEVFHITCIIMICCRLGIRWLALSSHYLRLEMCVKPEQIKCSHRLLQQIVCQWWFISPACCDWTILLQILLDNFIMCVWISAWVQVVCGIRWNTWKKETSMLLTMCLTKVDHELPAWNEMAECWCSY
jgi:hypothetical protein